MGESDQIHRDTTKDRQISPPINNDQFLSVKTLKICHKVTNEKNYCYNLTLNLAPCPGISWFAVTTESSSFALRTDHHFGKADIYICATLHWAESCCCSSAKLTDHPHPFADVNQLLSKSIYIVCRIRRSWKLQFHDRDSHHSFVWQ